MATPTAAPTQVQRPWRTTLRSAVQTAIPAIIVLGLVVPEVVKIILEETGGAMPEGLRLVLLGASAVVVAAAAVLTRVMAIPQVERFLRERRVLESLAAEPESVYRAKHAAVVADHNEHGHVDLAVAILLLVLVVLVLALLGFFR